MGIICLNTERPKLLTHTVHSCVKYDSYIAYQLVHFSAFERKTEGKYPRPLEYDTLTFGDWLLMFQGKFLPYFSGCKKYKNLKTEEPCEKPDTIYVSIRCHPSMLEHLPRSLKATQTSSDVVLLRST